MTDKEKIEFRKLLNEGCTDDFYIAYVETLLKEREQEVAKDICTLIDKIELQSTTSLEEWKQYKHIRNKIRDTYKVII